MNNTHSFHCRYLIQKWIIGNQCDNYYNFIMYTELCPVFLFFFMPIKVYTKLGTQCQMLTEQVEGLGHI